MVRKLLKTEVFRSSHITVGQSNETLRLGFESFCVALQIAGLTGKGD